MKRATTMPNRKRPTYSKRVPKKMMLPPLAAVIMSPLSGAKYKVLEVSPLRIVSGTLFVQAPGACPIAVTLPRAVAPFKLIYKM